MAASHKFGSDPNEADTVLVIGSGCTGLALAQGLKKAGVPCKIFEQRDALTAGGRDWNMGLHWGAPILQSLIPPEQWALLQSMQVDPFVPTKEEDALEFLNGATGDSITKFPTKYFYRIRRSRMRAIIAEGLDIQYNKRLANIHYSDTAPRVTVEFSDGTKQVGAIVIGCDGSKSDVRKLLLGPEKGLLGRVPYAATFIQMRYSREQALFLRQFHPLYIAAPHPGNKFAFFGMHEVEDTSDPEKWTFFTYISWPCSLEELDQSLTWSNKQQLEQVSKLATDFVEPWKSAFEWMQEENTVWHLGMTSWDPSEEEHRWDNHEGRVTLAGDAAHPMTFQRGQGLNHSLTDAANLRDLLVKLKEGDSLFSASEQAALVGQYDEEMSKRTGEEVRLSLMNTRMMHNWSALKNSPVFKLGLSKAS